MLTLTNDMMRSIIMDHYAHPLNKHQPSNDSYVKIHMHSDNCIDDIDVFLLLEEGYVKDACFDGVGCTIATASTDIMCELLRDKTYELGGVTIKNDNIIDGEGYIKQNDLS